MGADGLWLTPHDMLKIGFLYLNMGKWNDLQIIPSDWVLKSIQEYSPESVVFSTIIEPASWSSLPGGTNPSIDLISYLFITHH